MTALVAAAVALVAALLLTPLARALLPRLGAVDEPGERRVHARSTPTAGGLAIYAAFWLAVGVAVLLAPPARDQSNMLMGMFIGSTVLLGLCLLDDIYDLHPAPRFIGHILVATIAFQWGIRIGGLHDWFAIADAARYIPVGWLSAPLSVIWIVFIINAVNWLDGLDGLAAGVSAIAAATLAVMAAFAHMPLLVILGASLAAACLGFLRYNFAPATIFMGDTGAMFLGFTLACCSITGAFKSTTALAVIVPLLVLGVPIYDVVSTVLHRARAGKPIYSPDKTHLHHRLLARGLTTTQTVLIIYALTAVLGLVALGLWLR